MDKKIEMLTKAKGANSHQDRNYIFKKKKKGKNHIGSGLAFAKKLLHSFFSVQINGSHSVHSTVIHTSFPLQPLFFSIQLIHSMVIPPTTSLNKLLATN